MLQIDSRMKTNLYVRMYGEASISEEVGFISGSKLRDATVGNCVSEHIIVRKKYSSIFKRFT